jgi:hypothetical protein
MLVRGVEIRDIAEIEKVNISKVLSVLLCSKHKIKPKQKHYDRLEVDEFWTYVVDKQHKVRLIYAYYSATGEIVSYVWWKRNIKTAKRLMEKLKTLNVRSTAIARIRGKVFS